MTITLQKIAESVRTAAPCFLVVQRANGHWSPGAKIIEVCDDQEIAEEIAAATKRRHPQQTYGVFALRSEAHLIESIQTMRVPE